MRCFRNFFLPNYEKKIENQISKFSLFDVKSSFLDTLIISSVIHHPKCEKNQTKVIFPLLRPKRDYRKIAQFDECGIEFYWCPEERVIFLVPRASNDFSTLIELSKKIQQSDGEYEAQDFMKENDVKNGLATLFLLSVCHLALLIQPTTSLDIELDSWFHSVDECRKGTRKNLQFN